MALRHYADIAALYRATTIRVGTRYQPDIDHMTWLFAGYGSFQPATSVETSVDRDTVDTTYRYLSKDSGFFQAVAGDYLEIFTILYRVEGKPELWRVNNAIHHIEFSLRRIDG